MSKKISDNSPKFSKSKYYAIGVLIHNSSSSEVPEHFSLNPKPLYISGTDLLLSGIKSCRDFLLSDSCYFKVGSAVHFYEVDYHDADVPVYRNIFIGSPLLRVSEPSLSDKSDLVSPTINNIIPASYNASEHEKMLFKTQSEAINYYQKCLQDERRDFNNERNLYSLKISEQNDKILELNLQINSLKADNESLRIKYDESSKYADRLERLSEKEVVSDGGLADKGVAMLDGMLGDGASQQIVAGLASGLGSSVGKLLDLGIDYIRHKGLIKSSDRVQSESLVPSPLVASQAGYDENVPHGNNIDILKEQLQFTN